MLDFGTHAPLTTFFFSFHQEALMNAMNDELPRIQEQVYYGQISAKTDVLDKFLSETGIHRYNPQVRHNVSLEVFYTLLLFVIFVQLCLVLALFRHTTFLRISEFSRIEFEFFRFWDSVFHLCFLIFQSDFPQNFPKYHIQNIIIKIYVNTQY